MATDSSALVNLEGTGALTRLAVVVVLATLLAAVVIRAGRLGKERQALQAAGRAVLQLAAVGLIIAWVLQSWWLTSAFVVVMFAVATLTAARRLAGRLVAWTLVPVVGGALPVVAGLLASAVVPRQPIALVPVAGILIGGAMTATVLAGRRALDALHSRHGEYEAALSIGLESRPAVLLVARDDASLALVPGLDQTRTVGLVTLPGAFVGMLLGGAGPVEAAAVQLIVLVSLMLVQAVATVATVELVARGLLSARQSTGPS